MIYEQELARDLENYAKYCNDELGETCEYLELLRTRKDYISKELYELILVEMKNKLDMFKKQTKFITKDVTETRTITELEWS